MKRIFQIGLIVMVFLSTIGIPVYHHACLTESQYSNSFLLELTSCADEHEVHETPSCCAAEHRSCVENQHEVESTCCVDNVSYWQLSFFDFNNYSPVVAERLIPLNVSDYLVASTKISAETKANFSFKDPPNPSTLERLASLCIWRL